MSRVFFIVGKWIGDFEEATKNIGENKEGIDVAHERHQVDVVDETAINIDVTKQSNHSALDKPRNEHARRKINEKN